MIESSEPGILRGPLLISIVLAGIATRLWIWWNSIGSNDVFIWSDHAQRVLTNGLIHTYQTWYAFNHPPLIGLWAAKIWSWSAGDVQTFARMLKVPGLVGEGLTLWALWRFAGPAAFAVYAAAPAAILVSSFHGNTDALCAALIVLACLAFDRGRLFVAGLLWGAALNVKVLPLPFLPLILFAPRSWRSFSLVVAGLAIMAIPFLPVTILSPEGFLRNIVHYVPVMDNWGLVAFINLSAEMPDTGPAWAAAARTWYANAGRAIILLSIAAIAIVGRSVRSLTLTHQMAIATALFLFLAPGFGVQYVIYGLALLCLVDLRAGREWAWAAGAFILSAYLAYMASWSPMQSVFTGAFKGPALLFGLIAWLVLGRFLKRQIGLLRMNPAQAVDPCTD